MNNMRITQTEYFLLPQRNYMINIKRAVIFLLLLLITAIPAYAVGYSGIYSGTFTGVSNDGEFVLFIRPDNTAVIMGCDAYDGFCFLNSSITINSSTGAFYHSDIDGEGTSLTGTISGTSLSGTTNHPTDGTSTVSGNKKNNAGTHLEKAGYYEGTFQSTPELCDGYHMNGFAKGIIAADGTYYFYDEVTYSDMPYYASVGDEDGGTVHLNSDGSYSGYSDGSAYISGTVSGTLNTGGFINTYTHTLLSR